MVSQHSLEIARRAEAIYAERLQAQLEATHKSKFVAIEPDSQEYFLGNTLSEAIQAARRAYPGRKSFAMRIGEPMHLGVLFS
jgi:hypothetical protein